MDNHYRYQMEVYYRRQRQYRPDRRHDLTENRQYGRDSFFFRSSSQYRDSSHSYHHREEERRHRHNHVNREEERRRDHEYRRRDEDRRRKRSVSRDDGGERRKRPRLSASPEPVTEAEIATVPVLYYPELWSTHMTAQDYEQLEKWELESADLKNDLVKEIQARPNSSRKRSCTVASTSSSFQEPPSPKRQKMFFNPHHADFNQLYSFSLSRF